MKTNSHSGILVSVIVPVYNVVGYLDQCFLSIALQTHRRLQVIVVDDGSTDGSGVTCDIWAARDQRFEVVHQGNEGLSAARNTGVDRAVGDYLVFVDSDDYVHESFVEVMLAAALELDVDCVMCGYRLQGRWGTAFSPTPEPVAVSNHECLRRVVEQRRGTRYRIDTAPWNRIYARSLFGEHAIRFPGRRVYEGTATMFALMHCCGTIGLIPNVLYVHRERSGSIMQTCSESNLLDSLEAGEGFYADVAACYPDMAREARAGRERLRIASWIKWLDGRGRLQSDVAEMMADAVRDVAITHWRDLQLPDDWPYMAALAGLRIAPGAVVAAYRVWRRVGGDGAATLPFR